MAVAVVVAGGGGAAPGHTRYVGANITQCRRDTISRTVEYVSPS